MEETKNLNGTEEGGVPVPGVVDAADDEIRKAKELLRANGYVLFGYREAGEKIKQTTISGLNFVKYKWKDFGEWLSAKRAEMKARSDAAAEKRRLAEEAEARRTEAESARVGTVAESRSAGSNAVPRCAACGAELVLGARFCRKCGKSVSAVRDTPTAEPPAEAKSVSASAEDHASPAVLKCAACGAALVPESRFCRKCGKPVSAVRDTPTAEPPAEAKSVSATVEDPSESTGTKCAACGAALMVGMKFCGECGTPVNAKTRNPRQRKTDSPRKNTRQVEE